MVKYKIYEIARDIGKTSKEIIDFLQDFLPAEHTRKHNSLIYEEELNLLFEYLSKNSSVNDIHSYISSYSKINKSSNEKNNQLTKEATPKSKMDITKKEHSTTSSVSQSQTQDNKKSSILNSSKHIHDNNYLNNKYSQENNQSTKFNKKFLNNSNYNSNTSNNYPKNTPIQKKNPSYHQNIFKQKIQLSNNQEPKVANINKLQGIQTVDIRTSNVNLDKYNEKYEKITPDRIVNDDYYTKQKITQKSAQRSKQQFIKRETEAEKLRKLEEQVKKNKPSKIILPEEIIVGELASKLRLPATQVIKKLMLLGIMANVTQVIDYNTASLIAEEFDVKCEKEVVVTIEERLFDETQDKEQDLLQRDPVIVVMGHVDHGKTSLLDAIRNEDVTSTEAGGITQHIGAYRVKVNNNHITFLDTPGHEAFTSMRARGAQITDIAILVVAADDGIKPQTIEAIDHAKAAGITIIVAINKIDKPNANVDHVKQELMNHGLLAEEWGGDTICVPVSAKIRQNIDTLLEMICLVAEVKELRANPNRLAKGTVIEAKLDKGRGPVATLLIQNGTLHKGDIIIAGTSIGKVRIMKDDHGHNVETAGPSVPVEITGLSETPSAGDIFNIVENEKLARELVNKRKHEIKQERFNSYQKVTLDNLFSQISQGEMKELPIIVKADVNGSVEAIKQSLEKISNEEVRVKVIHGGVGAINKSDVMLANASNAIIIGFNVRPDPVAKKNAEFDKVDIRFYRIIYDAIEEITSAINGMLAPKTREVDLGKAEIRKIYKISSVGIVAGCYILEGKMTRNCKIRVVRDGIVIADDEIKSIRRVKDDVKEVASGFECGITLSKFMDIKEVDILEGYIIEEYRD